MAFNTPSMILPHVFLAENIQKLMKNKLRYDICGFSFISFDILSHRDALRESNTELQKKKKLIDELETQTTANCMFYLSFVCVCVCSTLFVF